MSFAQRHNISRRDSYLVEEDDEGNNPGKIMPTLKSHASKFERSEFGVTDSSHSSEENDVMDD